MSFPEFFETFPSITLRDPLCEFLGAGDGLLTYGYGDAVKLAGHSCPTVAGTWLMLIKAIGHLWPDGVPLRGGIEVFLPEAAEQGTTGVMAAVASLLTGARDQDGFKGIAGRFQRNGLLHFERDIPGDLAVRRADTGAGVVASLDLSNIPRDPQIPTLLEVWRQGIASQEELNQFGQLWQKRVQLMAQSQDAVVHLRDWKA